MQPLAFRSRQATVAQHQARSGISIPSRHASQPQPRRSTAAAAATARDATGSCNRLFAVAGAAAASLMMLVASPSPVLAAEGERCTLAAFDNVSACAADCMALLCMPMPWAASNGLPAAAVHALRHAASHRMAWEFSSRESNKSSQIRLHAPVQHVRWLMH